MRVPFFASVTAVGLASALGYALLDGSEEQDRAVGSARPQSVGARASGGYSRLIATLPEVGRLTWRCSADARSSTTLTLPRLGSTVIVSVDSDGRRVLRGKQLDPPAPGRRGRLATPVERVRRQSWRIRFDHKPAPVLAVVGVRFARSEEGECFVPRATTDVRTTDVTTP